MNRRLISAALTLAVLVSGFAVQAEPLPSDDRNVSGKFDNGLSYIIRTHPKPPGRVWLYLHVKTGALNETQTQNGIAHFMEHMAFNGSKHFKPGELIPLLNGLGMTFGVHTNAHTSFTETVFKLQMPDSDPKTLGTGLQVLQDFADGLLLSPEEIDQERGVVTEEWRSGKSAGERVQKQTLKDIFPEARINEHDVIGTDKTLAAMKREDFVDFYDTWYRPENMTLIVVGDIKPDQIVEPARKFLGSFTGRGATREQLKANLLPNARSDAFVITDPEVVTGEISMMSTGAGRSPVTTYERFKEETTESVGEWIVNRRLENLLQKGKAAYRSASVSSSDFLHEAMIFSADAAGEPQDWNKMLDQVVAEVHRAINFGFSARELELAKTEFLSGAERAVETEPTVDAQGLVVAINSAVESGRPMMSATQRLELTKRALAEVTLDSAHAAFTKEFKDRKMDYLVTLPAKKEGLTLPTSEEVLAAAASAWNIKVDAPAADEAIAKLLEVEPVPGKVANQTSVDALGITTVTFENGVVMHYKFVDYKKDQAFVRVTMPGGRIEETAETQGLSTAASVGLSRPATSRLTSIQITDLMTGKKVGFGGGMGLDSLTFSVNGSPKDLESGMQLLYAMLTDPKIEQSAFDDWKKNSLLAYAGSLKTIDGLLGHTFERVRYGDDVRLINLKPDQINAIKLDAAEAWLKRVIATAPIEVAVVGDLKLDQAVELVSKYIGSLPKRPTGFDALESKRTFTRPAAAITASESIDVEAPKAIVLAGFIGADVTPDTTADVRKLNLVSTIIGERMIERIREKERLVYSISPSNVPGRGLPGLGLFIAAAPTDPQNADKLADTILEMMKDFAKSGPTEAEMVTARKQTAKNLEVQMKEPTFWLGQMADYVYRRRDINELKSMPEAYQNFTADELREVAAKYMTDDRKIRVVVTPSKPPATQPATPAETAPSK